MQSKNELENNPFSQSQTTPKTAYSCYFETQLSYEDFGLKRKQHNRICNQLLLKHLEELNKEGIQLCADVSNEKLIKNICSSPEKAPHDSLVWEHCHSSTVIGGQIGVMRLVPEAQHTSGSEFWRIFHPEHKNRGGYHEWAIPRGAPVDKPKNYPVETKKRHIPQLKAEELENAFLVASRTNKFEKFTLVLDRAKQLAFSEQDTQALLTKQYLIGSKRKPETLLHLIAAHGDMRFIDALTPYFLNTPNFSQLCNYKGNTPAHVAAENNRATALQLFKEKGIDLTIKNKKQETGCDIVQARKQSLCLPYSQPDTSVSESQGDTVCSDSSTAKTPNEQNQGGVTKPLHDPQFVYGAQIAAKQKSASQTAKTSGSQPTSQHPSATAYKSYKDFLNQRPKKVEESTHSSKEQKLSSATPAFFKSYKDFVDKQAKKQIDSAAPAKLMSYKDFVSRQSKKAGESVSSSQKAAVTNEVPYRTSYKDFINKHSAKSVTPKSQMTVPGKKQTAENPPVTQSVKGLFFAQKQELQNKEKHERQQLQQQQRAQQQRLQKNYQQEQIKQQTRKKLEQQKSQKQITQQAQQHQMKQQAQQQSQLRQQQQQIKQRTPQVQQQQQTSHVQQQQRTSQVQQQQRTSQAQQQLQRAQQVQQ